MDNCSLNRKGVACNRSVAFLHVTCNTSMPDGEIAIEVKKAAWEKPLP